MRITKALGISSLLLSLLSLPLSAEETKSRVRIRPKVPLTEKADFLQSYGKVLIVPKGCVIVLPDAYKGKMVDGSSISGKVVSTKEFLSSNNSWLHLHKISDKQARGAIRFTQEELDRLKQYNKVVLAMVGNAFTSVAPIALIPEDTETNN